MAGESSLNLNIVFDCKIYLGVTMSDKRNKILHMDYEICITFLESQEFNGNNKWFAL